MSFAKRLTELRTQANLSQEALAELVDVSVASIYRWENGKTTPNITQLNTLCQIFNTSADSLIHSETRTCPPSIRENELSTHNNAAILAALDQKAKRIKTLKNALVISIVCGVVLTLLAISFL